MSTIQCRMWQNVKLFFYFFKSTQFLFCHDIKEFVSQRSCHVHLKSNVEHQWVNPRFVAKKMKLVKGMAIHIHIHLAIVRKIQNRQNLPNRLQRRPNRHPKNAKCMGRLNGVPILKGVQQIHAGKSEEDGFAQGNCQIESIATI